MRPLLLAYPGSEALAQPLRHALDAEPAGIQMREFPDGETYLRITGEVQNRSVAILCTLREPDLRLLPLVFMTDTLRELGVRQIGLIAPYLGISRARPSRIRTRGATPLHPG